MPTKLVVLGVACLLLASTMVITRPATSLAQETPNPTPPFCTQTGPDRPYVPGSPCGDAQSAFEDQIFDPASGPEEPAPPSPEEED